MRKVRVKWARISRKRGSISKSRRINLIVEIVMIERI